jgi:hypothetical protein
MIMASSGFAPKVRSEAVDRSSLGPLFRPLQAHLNRDLSEGRHTAGAFCTTIRGHRGLPRADASRRCG